MGSIAPSKQKSIDKIICWTNAKGKIVVLKHHDTITKNWFFYDGSVDATQKQLSHNKWKSIDRKKAV